MERISSLMRTVTLPPLILQVLEAPIPGALREALDLPPESADEAGRDARSDDRHDPGGAGAVGSRSGPSDAPGSGIILAGPGVLAARAVSGLRALAGVWGVGVANTWGAKGVFRWDDPHHLGTFGLQARDGELLGLAETPQVWTTGMDPAECPLRLLDGVATIGDIPPRALARWADAAATRRVAGAAEGVADTARQPNEIPRPALFEALAAVAGPGYADNRAPQHPARAVRDLKDSLPPRGVALAEPGLAGLWMARVFATDEPGSVIVPSARTPGLACALALVVAAHGRPAVVALTAGDRAGPAGEILDAACHVARAHAWSLQTTVWGDDVDFGFTSLLVDAAGPVVAWTV